jgi:hypothetical protein
MSNALKRDPIQMKKFATELEQFIYGLQIATKQIDEDVSDARLKWQDEMAQKAFDSIENFKDLVLKEMPFFIVTVENMRKSADFLERAQAVKL